MMAETKEFISKGRLDALTDGVFAFAMTLLVVNFDLPEDFHPTSAAELISALLGLGDTFIAYVVSFLVLATFWLSRARTKEEPEAASGAYAWSLLSHLFFVTLLPFSMIVAGRYHLAPAIWVYGTNMVLLALTAIGITLVIERDIQRRLVPSGPSRIRRADRFGYSLDGNRLLPPRWRDVRLFPQSCLAAGAEVDGARLSHVPDPVFTC